MKEQFLSSETYQKGFVLTNRPIYRKKTTDEEIDTTFNKIIKASNYNLHSTGISDKDQNRYTASMATDTIRIDKKSFSEEIIRKALMAAENDFFRFENIRKHIVGLDSIDTLIKEYLPKFEIKYTYEKGKDIYSLTPQEKLQLLVGTILPEVRKKIDLGMPMIIGDREFRPRPLREIFEVEKSIYLTSFPTIDPITGKKTFITNDERSKSQNENDKPNLRYDIKHAEWYAYDENYGTSEEKRFVKWIGGQIGKLREKYKDAEIYVIRNELDYCFYNPEDGRRFFPDYLMIINDYINHAMYYQCIIEPKGGHILEHDQWKEDALLDIHENSGVSYNSTRKDTKADIEFMEKIEAQGYQEVMLYK